MTTPRAVRCGETGAWLLVAGFPLALFALNDSWAYIPARSLNDAWKMTAYFEFWPQFLRWFPDAYAGTRLANVLPGWLAYQALPASAAHLALRVWQLATATIPCRLTLRRLGAGVWGASLGTLFLLSDTFYLQAAGWDYVNGTGLALIFWSLFLLAGAAGAPHRRWWLMGAGAAMLAAVWTYLMVAVLAVPFAWFYLRRRGRPQGQELIAETGWLLAGGAVLTFLLGADYYLAGGRFWFFLPQFFTGAGHNLQSDAWVVRLFRMGVFSPTLAWSLLCSGTWLYVPGLGALAGALLLIPAIVRRWGLAPADAAAAGGAMLLAAAMLTLVQLSGVWESLVLGVHATYLLPFAILALGLVFDRHLSQLSPRGQAAVTVLVAALLLASFAAPVAVRVPHPNRFTSLPVRQLLVLGAVAVTLAAAVRRPTLPGLLLITLGLAWLNLVKAPLTSWEFPARSITRLEHQLTLDAIRQTALWYAGGPLYFWYDFHTYMAKPDRDGRIANTIANVFVVGDNDNVVSNAFPRLLPLWTYSQVPNPLPTLPRPENYFLVPGRRIVLLGALPGLDEVNSSLAPRLLHLQTLDQQTVREGNLAFTLTLLEVRTLPPPPHPPANPS
jgi:hypothetical protein